MRMDDNDGQMIFGDLGGLKLPDIYLTRKVFGFEQIYMYEILVTGPLCTSECAGVCRFSANMLYKSLQVSF